MQVQFSDEIRRAKTRIVYQDNKKNQNAFGLRRRTNNKLHHKPVVMQKRKGTERCREIVLEEGPRRRTSRSPTEVLQYRP